MKYDIVRAVLVVVLHREVRQLLVKNRHASVVSDRRIRQHHTIPQKITHVDSLGDIGFLQHPQVNVDLSYQTEGRL